MNKKCPPSQAGLLFRLRVVPATLQRVPELNVMHWSPTAKNPLISRFPVGVVSLNKKAGLDLEIETGFVGEVHADRVITEFGRELDSFNGFAFDLGEAQNLARPFGLLLADRTFSFSVSHIRLSEGGFG